MKCRNTVWKLRWKLFKIRCAEVYMRYVKILILAIVEIIAELYNSKNGKG
ncbi:MAG: hypothetical protein II979_08410 [Clostridia bacterium]|nr:hypothetical protein [Clostridia bacterium]